MNLLPKLGVRVTDVAPGAALLSRSDDYRVERLDKRRWLLAREPGGTGGDSAHPRNGASHVDWQTKPLAPGAQLLLRETEADANIAQLQKSIYDFLVVRHVVSLLEHYRVNCVFDVGANTGQYAKQLRRAGYRGRIVSFEPVQEMVEKLRRAAEKDPQWHVYPYAAGNEDTTSTINVVSGSMSSMLGPSEFGTERYKRFRGMRSQQVEIRRLDGLLDEALAGIAEPRPYLKLDTQGFDLEAFHGVGDRIGEFVGMQSEVAFMRIYEGMPRMSEAVDTYETAGFEVTGMFPVTREHTTGRVLEMDCVMVRADAAPAPGD